MRRCPRCQEHKPADCFYQRRGKPAGYCKPCAKAASRGNYRASDQEKNREQRKAWQERAPAEYHETKRAKDRATLAEWRKANPEVAKERARASSAKRRASVAGMLKNRICAGMNAALSRRNAQRKDRRNWESLVGYTAQDLAAHLEKHFLPGMSWDNRSEWHIDHKHPISRFVFSGPDDPEFKMAWSLDNLQPLWATENQEKHAKLDWQRTELSS